MNTISLPPLHTPNTRASEVVLPQPEQDVGGMLRDGREAQAISKQAVADALHIPLIFVEALEKGNWSVMPAEVYARGYVRKYAEYLGFDVASIMQRLHPALPPKTDPIHTPVLRPYRAPINLKPWLIGGAMVLSGAGLAALLSIPPEPAVRVPVATVPESLSYYLEAPTLPTFYPTLCLEHGSGGDELWECYLGLRTEKLAPPPTFLMPAGGE
jgi:Helix-turn-helix domain